MKHKPVILSLFILVVAAQLYVPTSMILEREEIIEHGKTYKFKTLPIDPTDPFRGKYVTLSYEDDYIEIPGDSIFAGGQKIFVILKKGEQGFMNVEHIKLDKPSVDADFVKAQISYVNYYEDTARVHIQFPFDRYYMEEYKAPIAEEAYLEAAIDTTSITWALVKIKDGEAVLQDVMIDGVSINEFVANQKSE